MKWLISESREGLPKLKLTNDMITVSETSEGSKDKVLDGDNTTYWTSQKVEEGTVSSDNAWLQVDLGATYKLVMLTTHRVIIMMQRTTGIVQVILRI